jgi:hypothetical protein
MLIITRIRQGRSLLFAPWSCELVAHQFTISKPKWLGEIPMLL